MKQGILELRMPCLRLIACLIFSLIFALCLSLSKGLARIRMKWHVRRWSQGAREDVVSENALLGHRGSLCSVGKCHLAARTQFHR